jgi:ubiquinone/menaquinone biosynthesis C-methylase UbiE
MIDFGTPTAVFLINNALMFWVNTLDRIFYRGIESHWDDKIFQKKVLRILQNNARLLDAGAGAGILPETDFRTSGAEIWGIDDDARIESNPHLHHFVVGNLEKMPFESDFFDAIVSCNVAEHLENPPIFFEEAARILKKNGFFMLKTPNRLHYMPLIAQLTPLSFHRFIKSKMGKKFEDVFSKFYRVNTPAAVRRAAENAGFRVCEIELAESRPEYLRMNFFLYLFGIIYEKFINFFSLHAFKIVMFVVLQKK